MSSLRTIFKELGEEVFPQIKTAVSEELTRLFDDPEHRELVAEKAADVLEGWNDRARFWLAERGAL